MVTAGAYDEYVVLQVFGDQDTAEQWATEYNVHHPWASSGDKAVVEEVGFTPAGGRAPSVEQPVVVEGGTIAEIGGGAR
jgi:hypothetical protein